MALRRFFAALAAAAVLLGALAAQTQTASAHEYETKTGLTIIHPWARQNLPSRPGAAYMTIRNHAFAPDKLIGAHSPAFGRVEIHTHEMVDGVMKMRRVESLDATPGQDLVLAPHGNHLMLFDAKTPMQKGDMTPLTLVFEQTGEVEVMLAVVGLGETPENMATESMEHEGMGDEGMDMDHGEKKNIFGQQGELKPID